MIDRAAGTVTLPVVLGRTGPRAVPRADVRGARVPAHESIDSEGDPSVSQRIVVVVGAPDVERVEPIAEWSSEQRAAELAGWLQERLATCHPVKTKRPAAPRRDSGPSRTDRAYSSDRMIALNVSLGRIAFSTFTGSGR